MHASLLVLNTPHVLSLQLAQVMDNVLPHMRRGTPGQQTVFRARFSAVSAPEVKAAMVRQSSWQTCLYSFAHNALGRGVGAADAFGGSTRLCT
jgi:hypothetical protein